MLNKKPLTIHLDKTPKCEVNNIIERYQQLPKHKHPQLHKILDIPLLLLLNKDLKLNKYNFNYNSNRKINN